MKFCTTCGTKIENENALFCPNCGVKIESVSAEGFGSCAQQTTSASTQSDLNVKQGMKWFKFLIYFALIFGSVTNIVLGIGYISGDVYYVQTMGNFTAEELYYDIGYGFKVLNVGYGIALISIGAFGFYVRNRLSSYGKNAPLCLCVLYGLGGGLSLLYSNLASELFHFEIHKESTIVMLTPIIFAFLMIMLNYIYFANRKHLFVNK